MRRSPRFAALAYMLGTLYGVAWITPRLLAQSPSSPEGTSPTPPPTVQAGTAAAAEHPNRKAMDPLLAMIRNMTLEQKTQLMENIKAWQQVSPDVKQALRNRESLIRKKLKDEVDAALGDTPISNEQRSVFEDRYREERKKIDAALRAELEARRRESLDGVVQRLKKTLIEPTAPATASPVVP
ncbi:MAG: hypothetical protein WCL08_10805 [Verrucomicrobiota bacterium]